MNKYKTVTTFVDNKCPRKEINILASDSIEAERTARAHALSVGSYGKIEVVTVEQILINRRH